MKKIIFTSLMMMTTASFAMEVNTTAKQPSTNTLIREYSSTKFTKTILHKRSVDYPTQIVRLHGYLSGQDQTCEQVFDTINEFFNDQITYDRFFYNTIQYCSYDVSTNFATSFSINSYFDPLDNEAITYYQKYFAEHNGHNLLGVPFNIESAQGVIVSLDLDAGIENEQNDNSIVLLRHDNASHYFSNNYKMQLDLLADADERLFTHQSDLIFSFIGKWLQVPGGIYFSVLSKANYVELRPELIFLMDKEPRIFTPLLKLYYSNHCSKYENRHCL